MQVFRTHRDHSMSAMFLDNRRLSKQVLELYQIIRVCLGEMNIIDTNTRYITHPIVKHIFNNGRPYLIDALNMLIAFDHEHQRRGGHRSDKFRRELQDLESIILDNKELFLDVPLPPYFVYKDVRIHGESVYSCYESLLYKKWRSDKIPPRCNVEEVD